MSSDETDGDGSTVIIYILLNIKHLLVHSRWLLDLIRAVNLGVDYDDGTQARSAQGEGLS